MTGGGCGCRQLDDRSVGCGRLSLRGCGGRTWAARSIERRYSVLGEPARRSHGGDYTPQTGEVAVALLDPTLELFVHLLPAFLRGLGDPKGLLESGDLAAQTVDFGAELLGRGTFASAGLGGLGIPSPDLVGFLLDFGRPLAEIPRQSLGGFICGGELEADFLYPRGGASGFGLGLV